MIFTNCPDCGSHDLDGDLLEDTGVVPELQDTQFTCNDCGHTFTKPA